MTLLSNFTENKTSLLVFILCSILLIFISFTFFQTSHKPLTHFINKVDTDRFSGEWFVISNIPYFAEKNKVGTKTTYIRRSKNTFDDIFESHEKTFDSPKKAIKGIAKSLNSDNTKWQSTFYWLIKFNFEILYIDDSYEMILLGHKSRNYGWLMSRSKVMSQDDISKAMGFFKENNYDVSKFQFVAQLPQQLSNDKLLVSNE